MIFNFFATILWTLIVGMASYKLGEVVLSYAKEFKTYGIIFIIFIIVLFGYFMKKLD